MLIIIKGLTYTHGMRQSPESYLKWAHVPSGLSNDQIIEHVKRKRTERFDEQKEEPEVDHEFGTAPAASEEDDRKNLRRFGGGAGAVISGLVAKRGGDPRGGRPAKAATPARPKYGITPSGQMTMFKAVIITGLSKALMSEEWLRTQAAARRTNRMPTEAQTKAGNYRKGKVRLHGLTISIETPAGACRRGKDRNGKDWSVQLKYPYGYINRTEGADGDHVDVIIGPHPEAELAYVVDQTNENRTFDEHKVVLGALTKAEARDIYLSNYSPGWDRIGAITPVSLPRFRFWLREGDQNQPFALTMHEGLCKAVDAKPTLSKESVHYRKSDNIGKHCCGNCSMFRLHPPDFETGCCTLVKGVINDHYICDEWESAKLSKAVDVGWHGVDLDGTLAHYDGWKDGEIGAPVPKMVARIKRWLRDGEGVKIFTARVSDDPGGNQRRKIQAWSKNHLGVELPVTHEKDHTMIDLWDDRARRVRKNSGELVKPIIVVGLGKSAKFDEGEVCPHCGAVHEEDGYSGKCNSCGKERGGKKVPEKWLRKSLSEPTPTPPVFDGGTRGNRAHSVPAPKVQGMTVESAPHVPATPSKEIIPRPIIIVGLSKAVKQMRVPAGEEYTNPKTGKTIKGGQFAPQSFLSLKSPVVHIQGDEVSASTDINTMRVAMHNYMRSSLQGKSYVNRETGHSITIARSGINHMTTFGPLNLTVLQSLYALPKLLENAEYRGEMPDKRGRHNVRIHSFSAAVRVGTPGTLHHVQMIVRQDPNGHWYYHHILIGMDGNRLKKAVGVENENGNHRAGRSARPITHELNGGSRNSILPLPIVIVNLHKGVDVADRHTKAMELGGGNHVLSTLQRRHGEHDGGPTAGRSFWLYPSGKMSKPIHGGNHEEAARGILQAHGIPHGDHPTETLMKHSGAMLLVSHKGGEGAHVHGHPPITRPQAEAATSFAERHITDGAPVRYTLHHNGQQKECRSVQHMTAESLRQMPADRKHQPDLSPMLKAVDKHDSSTSAMSFDEPEKPIHEKIRDAFGRAAGNPYKINHWYHMPIEHEGRTHHFLGMKSRDVARRGNDVIRIHQLAVKNGSPYIRRFRLKTNNDLVQDRGLGGDKHDYGHLADVERIPHEQFEAIRKHHEETMMAKLSKAATTYAPIADGSYVPGSHDADPTADVDRLGLDPGLDANGLFGDELQPSI